MTVPERDVLPDRKTSPGIDALPVWAQLEIRGLRAENEALKAQPMYGPEGRWTELRAENESTWNEAQRLRVKYLRALDTLREIRDACEPDDPIFTTAAAALSALASDEILATCPECQGEKRIDYGTADAWLNTVYEPCDTCKGTGSVPSRDQEQTK